MGPGAGELSPFETFKVIMAVISDASLLEYPGYQIIKKADPTQIMGFYELFQKFITKNWLKNTTFDFIENRDYNKALVKMHRFIDNYDYKNYFESIMLHRKIKINSAHDPAGLNPNSKGWSDYQVKKKRYLTLVTKIFENTLLDHLDECFMFFADMFISR